MEFPEIRPDADPVLDRIARLHPQVLVRGKGCHVWDAAGTRWLDCHLAWGSVILGHAHPAVTRAIREQARLGTTIGGSSVLARDLQEILRRMVPGAGLVRFGKNGSDATLGAVRAARAHTGRNTVLRCGYHGFHDWSLAGEGQAGVPESLDRHIAAVPFNDLAGLEAAAARHAGDLAAIIIDPCVDTLASRPYLRAARALADRHGAVLIFDEIISGFRVARGGIQEIHGVRADLVCLGKSVANGMPLAFITGSHDLMREFGRIWYGLTFEQETVSMAAAKACLTEIERRDVPARLAATGDALRAAYAGLAREIGIASTLVGPPQRLMPRFGDSAEFGSRSEQALRFVEAVMGRGVILCNAINLSAAHDQEAVDRLVAAFRAGLEQAARPSGTPAPAHYFHKAEIVPETQALTCAPGASLRIRCRVRNAGRSAWRIRGAGAGTVNLGVRLYDGRASLIDANFRRVALAEGVRRGARAWLRRATGRGAADDGAGPVGAGEALDLAVTLAAPGEPGRYRLEFDCVEEGVTWFQDVGSRAPVIALDVRGNEG